MFNGLAARPQLASPVSLQLAGLRKGIIDLNVIVFIDREFTFVMNR